MAAVTDELVARAKAVNPDTLNQREWELFRKESATMGEGKEMIDCVPLDLAVPMTRLSRVGMVKKLGGDVRQGLAAADRKEAAAADLGSPGGVEDSDPSVGLRHKVGGK